MICRIGFLRKSIIWLGLLMILPAGLQADEYLQLLSTLAVDEDSAGVVSVTPVGDFNADGYDDLLVGVSRGWPNYLEAAYLFYGGQVIDSIPDLTFLGDPQNDWCGPPGAFPTYFGTRACGLGDLNADGIADFAIGAPGYCGVDYNTGRLYVYFGSFSPDTSADLIIKGDRFEDWQGEAPIGGDFNGDGIGDLLTVCPGYYYGSRVYIYLGGTRPDTVYDWLLDYTLQNVIYTQDARGGYDFEGDGFDDFGWSFEYDTSYVYLMFSGGDPIDTIAADSGLFGGCPFFPGDISGDSVDDMVAYFDEPWDCWSLCLGGFPLDIEPDYPLWRSWTMRLFKYVMASGAERLVRDNTIQRRLFLYEIGVPFDTVPSAVIEYDYSHGPDDIEVLDMDGTLGQELAMANPLAPIVKVYNIVTTGVDEENGLPENASALYVYPNPFNSLLKIVYAIPDGESSSLRIYDIGGRLIRLFRTVSGQGQVIWDAKNQSRREIPSGVYFICAGRPEARAMAKAVFMK